MRNESFGCKNNKDKIGVLIAQLGTPDAPTKSALRPYLKQFLSDRRVIEKNRFVWWWILNGIVLNTRPKRSAALYARIWGKDGKSPLLSITEKQTSLARNKLTKLHPSIEVEFGMRYGKPSLESAIDKLIANGCSKILLFPLYPQYSATTSASTYDVVFKHLLQRRSVPTLRVAEPYYAHPEYIDALATTINEAYKTLLPRPEKLVFSYHGIPESYIDKGDPYCCMCTETTNALLKKLEIPAAEIIHTYQSRFGRDPWLVPYTDETIDKLAKDGIKHIAVACPGFPTDCLETLDEIGNEAAEAFKKHGGQTLKLIPGLNDHPVWIEGMCKLIAKELGSWLETAQRTSYADEKCVCPVKLAKKVSANE